MKPGVGMKYWRLIAAVVLLQPNDPSRGVFVLGDKRIQIAQNRDGSVQWDGSPMTCDEIIIVLHEAEKNCGKMPAPFDKVHLCLFECLSVPTPKNSPVGGDQLLTAPQTGRKYVL
jgi:hypothetical protein